MTKQEFLRGLEFSLNGKISPAQITDNINYYEDYINTQIRMGRTEQDVLSELGDPSLIAKTIVTASASAEKETYQSYDDFNYNQEGNKREEGVFRKQMHYMPGWLTVLIVVLIFVIIINLLFTVLSMLIPVLLPVMVIIFFVKLFRDWLN